ncbi:MAG: ATP synthase F1 subunit delta [Gemmatimonadota bacterium]
MRDETVARSYAETLFALAGRHEGLEAYSAAIETVAGLLDEEPRFRLFLETPRIADAERKAVVRKAFGDQLPGNFVNFLLVTIDKRRQRLLRDISRQFQTLVDEHLGREHVEVTVARPIDEELRTVISRRLSGLLGRTAIPHVRVKPEILGGLIVRTGDTIYDGSLRRRLERIRRQLLGASLPSGKPA